MTKIGSTAAVVASLLLFSGAVDAQGGFGRALGNAGLIQRGMDEAAERRTRIEDAERANRFNEQADPIRLETLRLQNELIRQQSQQQQSQRLVACVSQSTTIGTKIRNAAGRVGTVTQLLGFSDRCQQDAAYPVLAVVVPE